MTTTTILTDTENRSNFDTNQLHSTLKQSQERIYYFLINIVASYPPEDVVEEFKYLFLGNSTLSANDLVRPCKAIRQIVLAKNESIFRETLKRCCYILINNWQIQRKLSFIQTLIHLFDESHLQQSSDYANLKSYQKQWISNFIHSEDYHYLQLFIAPKKQQSEAKHWSDRYRSYLLASQLDNLDNSPEQRESARLMSQQLKQEFKFNLAMFTSHASSGIHQQNHAINPTGLGDEVLPLIKIMLARKNQFNFLHIANIFVKQTQNIAYKDFKIALGNYLLFALTNPETTKVIGYKLLGKVKSIYGEQDYRYVSDSLLLRSCNKMIDYLTSEDGKQPADIFLSLMLQINPMIYAILLLKLILISPNSRNHLEKRVASLIKYYMDYPDAESQWIANCFDVLNIALAIYADQDVEYTVVKMNRYSPTINDNNSLEVTRNYLENLLDDYRIFSLQKSSVCKQN